MVGRGERTKGESTGHCILRGRSQTPRSHPAEAQSPSGLSQPWHCPCSLVPLPPPTRPGSWLRREGHRVQEFRAGCLGVPAALPQSLRPWANRSPLAACCPRGASTDQGSLIHKWRQNPPACQLCTGHGVGVVNTGPGGPLRPFQTAVSSPHRKGVISAPLLAGSWANHLTCIILSFSQQSPGTQYFPALDAEAGVSSHSPKAGLLEAAKLGF